MKKSKQSLSYSKVGLEALNVKGHFRRCHVCGSTTHCQTDEVRKCQHCQKPFAPFFYFEDKSVPVVGDNTLRPQTLNGEFYPIRGLTAYWDFYPKVS